jgi:hypothetical protein
MMTIEAAMGMAMGRSIHTFYAAGDSAAGPHTAAFSKTLK